jgi:hypothetical protein
MAEFSLPFLTVQIVFHRQVLLLYASSVVLELVDDKESYRKVLADGRVHGMMMPKVALLA